MNFSIISTIGPSCSDEETLKNMKKAGVDIFRVNMSHADEDELINLCELSKKLGIRLGLDTEGAQIRTKLVGFDSIYLEKEDTILLSDCSRLVRSDSKAIGIYPDSVISFLKIGITLRLDLDGAVVKVIDKVTDGYIAKCTCNGNVGSNKGVDILNQKINLPDFTKKDIRAIKIANKMEIKDIFISFCKSQEAIKFIRTQIQDCYITSKIESRLSIHNLPEICQATDAILIDRGDLSREINIFDIPFAQRGIIRTAKAYNVPCFVATNVLESLITSRLPTRAELNDIVSTIEMGAEGIVLAAETAIGRKPILCVEIIKELIHRYRLATSSLLFADIDREEITDSDMKVWLNRLSANT